jgi:hypothetical protein
VIGVIPDGPQGRSGIQALRFASAGMTGVIASVETETLRMIPFKTIRARAEKRKGGAKALATLIPAAHDNKALTKLGDDRILAEMAKRVFCAGFVWRVIEQRTPNACN